MLVSILGVVLDVVSQAAALVVAANVEATNKVVLTYVSVLYVRSMKKIAHTLSQNRIGTGTVFVPISCSPAH